MGIDEMGKRAIEISDMYALLNKAQGLEVWSTQDFMAGFVGDVGDLSKIIMAKNSLRQMEDVDTKLAHELSDCLWSILVLAQKCNIDLADEFAKTMGDLEKNIAIKLESAA
jgi:NTP pyrophosphatase (non-canonical NTP hydrolase)